MLKNRKILLILAVIALLVVFAGTSVFLGCTAKISPEVQAAAEQAGIDLSALGKAKYAFLFIGDGMALPQINAAEAYMQAVNGGTIDENKLAFSKFPAQGLTTTYSNNSFITDSASAGTAISTGFKTDDGVICMDPTLTKEYKTIAEMAKEEGMKVGIISSVSIDHATPACFYAHDESRNNYYQIDMDLVNSPFDFFGGGGMRQKGKEETDPDAYDLAEQKGFKVVYSREDMNALQPGEKALAVNPALADSDAFYYTIDQDKDYITLAEYTERAIELLDNEKGFFIMVEAGKIDWACHANDAGSSIHDTLAFDDAIKVALDFYNNHKEETLIVVTGDHECGGMTLGFAGTQYSTAFDTISGQSMSFQVFSDEVLAKYKEETTDPSLSDLMDEIEQYFGLTDLTEYEMERLEEAFELSMMDVEVRPQDDQTYLLYGGYEPLAVTITHLLNQRAGIGWTSYSHTGVPVPTFAQGVGNGAFNGYYDNTDIFKKMFAIMPLQM